MTHRNLATLGLAIAGLLLALAACSRGTAIPAGAQQVHVEIRPSEVRIQPATVHAGTVYLVLDAPADGHLTFVARRATAAATDGPLTEADLARLRRGDTEGTSIGGLDAGGCDPAQDAEDRGKTGPCGNVMEVVLSPGIYAIMAGMPEADAGTAGSPPMAVLEVTP